MNDVMGIGGMGDYGWIGPEEVFRSWAQASGLPEKAVEVLTKSFSLPNGSVLFPTRTKVRLGGEWYVMALLLARAGGRVVAVSEGAFA